MIEFKEEHHDEPRKFSSVPIKSEVLTINSKHPYSEDHFESKFQDNISPYNEIFEQPEEEFTPLKLFDCNKLHSDFYRFHTNIKAINYNITAMLAKLNDKSVKKNYQDDKITELSSK